MNHDTKLEAAWRASRGVPIRGTPIKQPEYGVDMGPASETRRCCKLARKVSCVCRESIKCPVHGSRCFGTHD